LNFAHTKGVLGADEVQKAKNEDCFNVQFIENLKKSNIFVNSLMDELHTFDSNSFNIKSNLAKCGEDEDKNLKMIL